MNDQKPIRSPDQHRLIGEETPRWFILSFVIMGLAITVSAVWLWGYSKQPSPATPVFVAEVPQQAPAPEVATNANQLPVSTPKEPIQHLAGGSSESIDGDASLDVRPSPVGLPATEQASAKPLPPNPGNCPESATIAFKRNSASLGSDSEKRLEKIVVWLKAHPTGSISVEGHADSKGTDQHNLLLSYRRAQSVVSLLKTHGIDEGRLMIRAAGSHNPIKGLPANGQENRRTTVQIVDAPECQTTQSQMP